MLVAINGKIVKPKIETKNKSMMSSWFKKWLIVIAFLFFLFFASATLLRDYEGLVMGWLVFFLLGLLIFALVVTIQTIITFVKKFLKFKMVIYY